MSAPRVGSRRGLAGLQEGRRAPGRPRTAPKSGHNPGIADANVGVNGNLGSGALVSQAIVPLAPRLLDLEGAAQYLAVSSWTVRDLEAGGVLARVRVPLPNGGELRKLLFARADLDRLIEGWKDPPRRPA